MRDLRAFVQDHPRPLELAYHLTERLFRRLAPWLARLGYHRVGPPLAVLDKLGKRPIFGCQMCGQCTLQSTGMTCPMTCPKLIRNGPCGGVRAGGFCEVYPDRQCIWVQAYQRSQKMRRYGQRMLDHQPPLDWRLAGTSAWINLIAGEHEARLSRRVFSASGT
jgi:hypothetical protein